MRKTKRKGSKGRSIKRRSTKHGSTKGRTTKRSGAKRGGGNAPAKVFEDGGILFSNASVQRMLNDEDLYINRTTKKMSFQDFIDLLNKDIKKEHKNDGRSLNDAALGGTVLHTLVDKIYDLTYENFKEITDVIFSNKHINKIINIKNDNGKTALEEMVAEIVSRGDTAGNFNENHRKYLAKKLSDVPGLVIPKPPKKGRGVKAAGVDAAIELINIANKKATYVARDMKPTKSATAVKAAVTSNDSKGSGKGSRRVVG